MGGTAVADLTYDSDATSGVGRTAAVAVEATMHGRLLISVALGIVAAFTRPVQTVGPQSLKPGVSLEESDRPAFSATSDLVVLHVMVTDKRGSPVAGLSAEAFDVREDGKPQAVQFF